MISRATLHSSVGGDTVQVLETANALRRLGVEVDVKLTNEQIAYENYDIVHFFNIIRPADILKHVEGNDLPFVISTIFVDYEEFEKVNRKGLIKMLNAALSSDAIELGKAIARYILNGEKIGSSKYFALGHKRSIQYLIAKCSMLLPNSESEYQRLYKKYRVAQEYVVVPNAINIENFNRGNLNAHLRDGVICVGRIEARKNQMNLIRALNELGYNGLIIGDPSPNSLGYYQECKRVAGPNIEFVNHVPHDELVNFYLKSKVHVLPSWFETTGLSSLEAAVMGCNIVVSPKGDTEEYFKQFASYCDPASVDSIKKAISIEYERRARPELREYIISNYTWERTGEQTLLAYKRVLGI